MKLHVNKKHNAAKGCFVCGVENPMGLQAEFYELEDGTMAAKVQAKSVHQSYPGRVHGGVSTAILDETIGRAINVTEPDTWAVTVELTTKYKRPVPYDVPLTVTGKITKNTRRLFEGEGSILLPDGTVAVTAIGKYMKMKLTDIADFEANGESWTRYEKQTDPDFIELPEA